MSESVICALITGAVAMLGSLCASLSSANLTAYKIDELKADLDDLRERVNKHNNLMERMAVCEERLDHLEGRR